MRVKALAVVCAVVSIIELTGRPLHSAETQFRFQDNFWVNLHLFVRAEARRRAYSQPPVMPVSALSGTAQIMGRAFPMTYFVPVSLGVFTKGLRFGDLSLDLIALAVFIPVLTTISLLLLRKQER